MLKESQDFTHICLVLAMSFACPMAFVKDRRVSQPIKRVTSKLSKLSQSSQLTLISTLLNSKCRLFYGFYNTRITFLFKTWQIGVFVFNP